MHANKFDKGFTHDTHGLYMHGLLHMQLHECSCMQAITTHNQHASIYIMHHPA